MLVDKFDLKPEHLKMMDKKMQKDILPYLKSKYPMSVERDSNKAL